MMNKKRKAALALVALLSVSAVPSQSQTLRGVMRQKLEHSQQLLAAIVTSDWVTLDRHSRALERLTRDPAWTVLNTPEYARYSTAFVNATRDLIQAATERKLEAAALAYTVLTLSCVQCHRYVARNRIAK